MIVGDPSIFAIESGITQWYENPSLRGLGFFVIHVSGRRYGVYKSDATMLANSFDEVNDRISNRGRHSAPFVSELDAGKIADAFRNATFADDADGSFFGMPLAEFKKLFSRESNDLIWAPDGDEAFDDGSYVLQFDVDDRVRLIAFKCHREGYRHDSTTLSDAWLAADMFYGVLQQWHDAFESEWCSGVAIDRK